MITYPRSDTAVSMPTIRILGLGNAGVHLADRIAMLELDGVDVVALNTDAQSLASSVAPRKIALGEKATRGLGAGGDPELGYEAAQESLSEIRDAVEGAGLIFLCAGLGGGTASGAAAVIAESAREAGATVFALVTSPFSFEGKRRSAQATEAIAALTKQVQALVHFENDRMVELASPRSGIQETFGTSDAMLATCIVSLVDMLRGGGPMPIGLADLLAATGAGSAAALFGRGEATGDNRAHEALEKALKSPLLDRGRLLEESYAVIAHISGPPSLSFAETAAIMRELSKLTPDTAMVFLGVTTLLDASSPVAITILGNYEGDAPAPVRQPARRAEAAIVPQISLEPSEEEEAKPLFNAEPEPEAVAPVAPVTPPPVRKKKEESAAPKPSPAKVKQETLQFEPVARGRFEKSEPTIVEGEDLDVPTFLRIRGKTN